VSQLAHRLFGPLQPARIRVVLDYHGLLVNRAGALADIAARHHVTASTVSYNTAAVRAAGIKQPLSPSVVIEAERDSTPDDDHLGRVRIATTLGLTRPELASVGHPLDDGGSLSSAQLAVARTALRLLTAVGPLTLPTIAAAVARSRRFRDRDPVSDADLAAAMLAAGCTTDDLDRWHPPAGAISSERDHVIVTRAAGREITRAEMIDILLAAGYRESSATGRMSSSHPLFQRTGPGWYRLVGEGDVPGSAGQLGQVSG
jgi:hypothetical protein